MRDDPVISRIDVLRDAVREIFPWASTGQDKGPTEANHRLTALTGSLLVPLLGLVFLTGLLMDTWWHIHYAVGFVLIPVVVLKLASTGYRAMRYYTGNALYRAAGPPELLPRLLAPLLAVSVVTALVTGVALYVEHSRSGILGKLHTLSAVSSALLLGVHMLIYIPDVLATAAREIHARFSRALAVRVAVVAISLAVGIVLAIVTYNSGVWPSRPYGQRDGSGVSVNVPAVRITTYRV